MSHALETICTHLHKGGPTELVDGIRGGLGFGNTRKHGRHTGLNIPVALQFEDRTHSHPGCLLDLNVCMGASDGLIVGF